MIDRFIYKFLGSIDKMFAWGNNIFKSKKRKK